LGDDSLLPPILYASIAAGAGVALLLAAFRLKRRARTAWSLIGTGVLCWGIGEAVWTFQSIVTREIPYPGPADFFYVAGYPLIFAGVMVLPYLRPGRFERLRLAIDATAGALSLWVVMWVAYLADVVLLGPVSNPGAVLNLFYPLSDVLLATGLMVLAMRRSEQRIDFRILLLGAAVALTTVADVIFAMESAAGTYVEWGPLDGLWLYSYSAFALTAWAITKPDAVSDVNYRSVRGWQLVAPYTAVASLFIVRLATSSGNSMLLNVATTGVAALVVLRQVIAVRERRELVERQRDDLVASVSHELRTPLTGIQGYAQLLEESWEEFGDVEKRQIVGTIRVQSTHLGRIVTDLIDVARDRLQNVDLHRSTHSAAGLMREAIAVVASDRKIVSLLDEDAVVEADPDRIRQVIVNLVTNAIRYGRSQVTVAVESQEGQAAFSVHDDGDGVPPKHQNDIWDRFERGAHRFNATVPGSGIGLSVARDLVMAHGGTIRYRTSELLGGACFEFSLPSPSAAALELTAV
jgi:signal transduction histidine kinase